MALGTASESPADIRAGNKIEAIRQQHLDTGAGLAEAKAAVEAFGD